MKIIEVDEELYQYIASRTESIGESASDILRRLLALPPLASGVSSPFSSPKRSPVLTTKPYTQTAGANTTANAPLVANPKSANKPKTATQATKNKDKGLLGARNIVDNATIVQNLNALLSSPEFMAENKAVVRFLAILRLLYLANPEAFSRATETSQGRTRLYFSKQEAPLLKAGNHTKPKPIPDTPYWVITNTNSGRKMLMLEAVMQTMALPADCIEKVRSFFAINS